MKTEPIKSLLNCKLIDDNILLDENDRRVLVQIDMEFFELKSYRPIDCEDIFDYIATIKSNRYNIQELKGE